MWEFRGAILLCWLHVGMVTELIMHLVCPEWLCVAISCRTHKNHSGNSYVRSTSGKVQAPRGSESSLLKSSAERLMP